VPLPGAATDYDGVNLLVLRDLQAASHDLERSRDAGHHAARRTAGVSTYVRDFTLVCEEQVLRDQPAQRPACWASCAGGPAWPRPSGASPDAERRRRPGVCRPVRTPRSASC
jgi:hypothetical protein